MLAQPNYTQCPNRILDNIAKFTPAEFCCLMYLARITLGWRRQKIRVSTRAIAQAVGMTHQHIGTQLKSLEAKGWIIKTPSTSPQRAPTYSLHIVATGDDTEGKGVASGVATESRPVASGVATLKDSKALNKKHIGISEKNMRAKSKGTSRKHRFEDVELPPAVSRELWKSFLAHRRELRRGVTKQSCTMLLTKLVAAGPRANELLSKGLENGWVGLDVGWLTGPASRSSQELVGGDRAGRSHPEYKLVRGQASDDESNNRKRNEFTETARTVMASMAGYSE